MLDCCPMENSENKNDLWGSAETKYFYELTPDRILDAVETFGVRCTGRSLALNSLENRVYDVEIEVDGTISNPSEAFRVVKFYRPNRWTKEQILEEHQFILDLAEQEIPVVVPITDHEGSTLRTDPSTGIYFALFPKVGGRILDEFSNQQIEVVGRLLARLHNTAATRTLEHRLALTPDSYGLDNAYFLEDSKLMPQNFEERYVQIVEQLCDLVTPWFEETSVQRIHGDCHLGNILWRDQELSIVDFDDSLTGPCVQDIWLLIPGRDEESKRLLDRLLNAYEEFRSFDNNSLRLIEALRSLRMIHFNSWIARRWSDPAFKKIFPDYGSEKYWNEQITALYEQLEILNGVHPHY